MVCAVDLGGTNLRAANVDRDGRIHARIRQATPAAAHADEIVAAISSLVSRCEIEAVSKGARLGDVCVVVPGSVHAQTGVIVNAPNIPALAGCKLSEALERETGRKTLLENDANAAAIGEMWQGAARGRHTIVCLTLGTGVGSGIILNGQLWRGIDGTAGEIGHTSVDPFAGVHCKCGNIGCLEVYASATAIVRMVREELLEHSESSLSATSPDELTAETISQAARDGDEFALGIFRRVGRYLGVAIANTVNTLNPEMIVVGGGVSAAFDLFAQTARAEMSERAFPVPAQRCQIVQAECGDDAGLLGAAWLTFQNRP